MKPITKVGVEAAAVAVVYYFFTTIEDSDVAQVRCQEPVHLVLCRGGARCLTDLRHKHVRDGSISEYMEIQKYAGN